MAIEDRNLEAGTRLVATYKKRGYVCLVEKDEEGKLSFSVEGKSFTSPSAAASSVMGGQAANGWRFWSVEGEEPPARQAPRAARKGETARNRVLQRTPNQKGVEAGKVRWFCSACMKGFLVEAGAEPEACPEGHRVDEHQPAPA